MKIQLVGLAPVFAAVAGVTVLMAASLVPTEALAVPVKWTIPAMPLQNGGSISGTFTYDADTNVYSAINVATTGGAFPAETYVRVNNAAWNEASMVVLRPTATASSIIAIYLDQPLTNAGGSIQVTDVLEGTCIEECWGFGSHRTTTNPGAIMVASPAPIPTMTEWAMIVLALTLAGGAALTIQRRRLSA